MLTVAWLLLAALAGLAVLVLVLLALPVTIEFEVRTSPRWRVRIGGRFLGGATGTIPLHDTARRRRASRKAAAARKGRPVRGGRMTPSRALRVAAGAPGLAAGLLRPIRLRRLAIDADIGLDDPADTGMLFGLINAAVQVLPAMAVASVALRPDFARPRAEGRLDAEIRFVPLAFVPPAVRFAWQVFGRRR